VSSQKHDYLSSSHQFVEIPKKHLSQKTGAHNHWLALCESPSLIKHNAIHLQEINKLSML